MKNQFTLKRSVIAVALTLGAAPLVLAQNTSAASGEMQRVVVTGSNLKRTDKEGPAPVSVMTAQDIKDTGVTTVAELMKLVPSMGTDANQDFGSGSGFAKGVSTASLRGLSSSSTLILLNGRRMTPSAYADPNDGNSVLYDLNSIPVSAIERIEVLQDGASAVYGSDAIGGVINFILKSNYNGAEISARGGANDDGNFRKKGVNVIYGHGDLDEQGYSFMVTADFGQRDRTARKDATDIEYEQYQIMNGRFKSNYSSTVSNYPVYFRETKPGSKSFGVTQANGATNMQFNLGCPASEQITGGTKDGFLSNSPYIGRTFCNYDIDRYAEAQGAGKDASVLSRGELKLPAGMTGFAELAYTRSTREYTGAPISIGTNSVTTFTQGSIGTPFQAILPVGHPDNPWTDANASINYRFTSLRGGSRTVNDGARALAGVKGSNAGWDWESAVLWNRSERDETQYGRLYLPTLRKLTDQNMSLAQLNADPTIGHDVFTHNMAQIAQWDAKATTEFGHLPGGAMGLAAGVEVRRESIKLNPDPLVGSGQIYGLANTVIDSSRNVKSAFVELRTPFTKNFEMDFAGRFDKYPTIKTNFVPKVGAKWNVTDKFAVRGTYAEGFRAPSLTQVAPGGAQYFLNGIWDPKRCNDDYITPKPGAANQDCKINIGGTGGYNPNLKPETSKSLSLGFIFSPTSQFDLLVDFYKIKLEDEIVQGSANDALKYEDRDPQYVMRDPNPVNWVLDANGNPVPGTGPLLMVSTPWINRGKTEVGGADIEARLRNKLGELGSLSTTLRVSYTGTYHLQQYPGDVEHNLAGSRPYYQDWALSSGTDMPRWKGTLATTWKKADHAVNASVNYVGPVSLLRVYDGATTYPQPKCVYPATSSIPLYTTYYPQCGVKEWVTVGLGYTFTGFKHWTLNANIQNLFDTKAPYDPDYGSSGFNEGLHNPYGRYFNVSARYKF